MPRRGLSDLPADDLLRALFWPAAVEALERSSPRSSSGRIESRHTTKEAQWI